MCETYNYQEDICCISQSLYYNFIGEKPIRLFDHLYLGNKTTKEKIYTLNISDLPRHLAWTDAAFKESKFRDMLGNIVGFKNDVKKTPYNEKISKIRECIKNGTIVKEYNMDGTYIWKKVRK